MRPASPPLVLKACADCIRGHEEFLASDAMQGRGSATHDELVAATYVGAQFRQYGVQPAGEDGTYIQGVPITRSRLTPASSIRITPAGPSDTQPFIWTYGKQFLVASLSKAQFSGPLLKLDADGSGWKQTRIASGSVLLVTGSEPEKIRKMVRRLASSGAAAALFPAPARDAQPFQDSNPTLPGLSGESSAASSDEKNANFDTLELSQPAVETLLKLPDRSQVAFEAQSRQEPAHTWNAVGILRGSDPGLRHSAVLLSAHLDHLGIGIPVKGDAIYNGADDDASGTTAVLELARVLGKGPRPRRTVIFACFGSEETGGLGSAYFGEHPPLPLEDIAANLEFEMIGRADPLVTADALWITGWERSNLGPTLAKHGANVVADPHPEQNFFTRSDNYVLAKKGVVAQTISSFGLHPDYHQPSDDLAHLDFKHLDAAIGSLLGPVDWLVNSSFRPTWNRNGRP